ncbi:TPA: hypothetical protein ACOQZT_001641 [Serratia odorifera]|jgi:hypothetical protein|uniref:hypothetical protein n=1 Tax=Serratia odorifera TaxID=618 RepID=UPI0018E90103|nr:hypothetical protein [Serratia odorifera]MBJ2066019.1 hypothetical protein [Serratia odorifera]HEJ9094573.1 hypothetical protein [Serratia odorifera]
MFSLSKLFAGKDCARTKAIKMLPQAYAEMVGDAGQCRVKHLRPSIGVFELHFSSASGVSHVCQMTACVTGVDLVFATNNRNVLVSPPFTPAKLRPVFAIALAGSEIALR